MSSSFRYTLTKLRSLPASLNRCALSPPCFFVRSASSSPTVAPSASTASFLSVYGLSGVGIRIFVAMELALFETGSVLFEIPDGHAGRSARHDRHNHIRERRPRMIEIELGRPRRVIGMGVIEPEQPPSNISGPLLGQPVVRRPDEKSTPRSFLGRIGQRDGGGRTTARADQRTAAFVRVRLLAVSPDRVLDPGAQADPPVTHRPSRTTRTDTSRLHPETP